MFNNRMLAVAAVLAMAVPALGAATPIVVPPEQEQLVEGHTVFTVIEIAKAANTTDTNFAAAVAVLVREYNAQYRNSRFPGVLWFNDQYLVSPSQSQVNAAAIRYPCGGAVMAVNRGDPDPRMTMVQDQTNSIAPITGAIEARDAALADNGPQDSSIGTNEYTYSSDYSYPPAGYYSYGNDFSQVGISAVDPTGVYADTLPGVTSDYEKSYMITDPNDHTWVIDVYTFYTRTGLADPTTIDPADPQATVQQQVYASRVWVVNIGGAAVFTPDMNSGLNCPPFEDLISAVVNAADPVGANRNDPVFPSPDPLAPTVETETHFWDGDGDGNPDSVTCGDATVTVNAPPPVGAIGMSQETPGTPETGNKPTVDEPCAGYNDPGNNGICYQGTGQAQTAASCAARSPRLYNALLYFELEDLRVPGANGRDHDTGTFAAQTGVTDQTDATQTNGCHDSASRQWDCTGTVPTDDDEGFSHPFHPDGRHPMGDVEPCQAYIGGPNAYNHGGSYWADVNRPGHSTGAAEAEWTPCDNFHATRDIDVYFSGAGRPWEPVVRAFAVLDTEGSTEPFYLGTH